MSIPSSTYCSIRYTNCSLCIKDERCGWCSSEALDDLYGTGLGVCLEGGEALSVGAKCKQNWYFSKCPSCECNGHATCKSPDTSPGPLPSIIPLVKVCNACSNNTLGANCESCKSGYYGNARNDGVCLPCECGQQSDICDTTSGRCYCNTKGVIGSRCDQCETPRYTGKPYLPDGSCYYNLTTDYQFTFNLNKEMDRFYTRINFVNHPMRANDDDIDFMVRCHHSTANINVAFLSPHNLDSDLASSLHQADLASFHTAEIHWPLSFLNNLTNIFSNMYINNPNKTQANNLNRNSINNFQQQQILSSNLISSMNYYFGPKVNQVNLLTLINCSNTEFKYTFSNRDLNLGDGANRNSTFVVNVYNFHTPITIQIAFSRRSRIQLLHFFITFFGCLFSLLTIAFITWKSKQRYDRYRRQRQIIIQMEHMASRPFARLLMDVSKPENSTSNKVLAENVKAEQIEIIKPKIKPKLKKGLSAKKSVSKLNENSGFSNGSENGDVIAKDAFVSDFIGDNSWSKIIPVAVEPLSNNKTAILTCILKLPQGDLHHTPKGSSPFILASTYVQVNSSSSFVKVNPNVDDLAFFDEDQDPTGNSKSLQMS